MRLEWASHGLYAIGWMLSGAALFMFSTARAALTNAPADEIRDFSQGFAHLRELGLPDTQAAEYTTLEGNTRSSTDYALRELGLKGNAWLLKEDKTNASIFIVEQARPALVYDMATFQKLMQEQGNPPALLRRAYGQWHKANLEADLQKALEALAKLDDSKSSRPWALESGGWGQLLLFAAHVHAKGLTNQANQFTAILIEKSKDPQKAVVQAYNHLANSQYEQLYEVFTTNRDWAAFAAGLKNLLERFPGGWTQAPAVQRLEQALAVRIAQAPPVITGEGLGEEERQLAQRLAEPRGAADPPWAQDKKRLWTLDPPVVTNAASENPIRLIQARGAGAIPLLVALLGDEYLTEYTMADLRGGYSSSSSYSSSRPLDEEMITEMYNQMNRPVSRADIAANLLTTILPPGENSNRRQQALKREDLKDEVAFWVKEHKLSNPREWARTYLQEGDDWQRTEALQYLLAAGGTNELAELEAKLLDKDQLQQNINLIQAYVQKRGPQASNFVERFESLVADVQVSEAENESENQWIQAQIKALKALTTETSTEELLAQLQDESQLQYQFNLFRQAAKREGRTKFLEKVLRAATAADHEETRIRILGVMLSISMYGRYELDEVEEAEAAEALPSTPVKHPELWRSLLLGSNLVANKSALAILSTGDANSRYVAAILLERLYCTDKSSRNLFRDQENSVPVLQAEFLQRAFARLEGVPEDKLPPVPNATQVSTEQVATWLKAIQTNLVDNVPALLAQLSGSEYLAVSAAIQEDPELRKKLAPVAHYIREVVCETNVPASLLTQLGAWTNKGINREDIEAAIEVCQTAVSNQESLVIIFRRTAGLNGGQIVCGMQSTNANSMLGYFAGSASGHPGVVGAVMSPADYKIAFWKAGPAKAPEQPAADTGDELAHLEPEDDEELDPEQADEFWEGFETLVYEGNNIFSGAGILLMSCPATDPVKKKGR